MSELSIKQTEAIHTRRKSPSLQLRGVGWLYLFMVPGFVLTILFSYLPMFSNVIAFMDYDFLDGWMGLGSPFVGFANFSFLGEPWFYRIAGRTALYSVTLLLFSFPAPLVLALLFNELHNLRFKKIVQTISYIPHFVSWVTVAGLVYLFLSVDPTGLVNNLLATLGVSNERVSFMQDSSFFLPLLVITQIWKGVGWGTILYLAAISTIDPNIYEAAEVDGATRWQRVRYITLPGIFPTTAILLIFALGGLFSSNFDQMVNLQNSVIRLDTDTLNVFTYYRGILAQQYSFATAFGLFQGLISFLLIMGTNAITKRIAEVGII